MNFLDALQMELAELDLSKISPELAEPRAPVQKNERVMGEVEESNRKFFVLA